MSEISEKFHKEYLWISKDFIRKILEKLYPEINIDEINLVVKPALSKGENYASQMIQIDVHYTESLNNNQISFIMKTELKEMDFIKSEYNIFDNETVIFAKILPMVDELLTTVDLQEQIGARLYSSGCNPSYLVLENLKNKGYRILNRKHGLDYEHLKCVVKKLAKYHAATAVIGTNLQPDIVFNSYMQPTIHENSQLLVKMLKNTVNALADVCQDWAGYENIHDKLLNIVDNISKKCCAAFLRDDNDFNVLCHGDLWSNNIMFKDNDGDELEDVILVDFQIGYWGSPALDLCYLFYLSSAADITEKDWDHLIHDYYKMLRITLLKLNYAKSIPSLTEIQIQVLKRGIYAAILTMFAIGIRKTEDEDDMNMQVFLNDNEKSHKQCVKMLSMEDTKEHLQKYLDFCNRKGYLD